MESVTTKLHNLSVEYYYSPAEKNHRTVLLVHGNGGAWKQALLMADSALPSGTGVLAVSRFGYSNSELPKNSTPAYQAQIFNALLEKLDIERVIVFYTSAGSFSGMRFALDYRRKTMAVISLSGVAFTPEIEMKKYPPSSVISDMTFRLFLIFPSLFRHFFGISRDEWRDADEETRNEYNEVIKLMFPVSAIKKGMINDFNYCNDAVGRYSLYDMEKIECPVLILHSSKDPWNSEYEIRRMGEALNNSRVVIYKGGGHLLLGHGKDMKLEINHFLNRLE